MESQNQFRFALQRSRGTQRICEIKKAVFEVWRPGSLLRNAEMVARGYQELAPLLSVGQIVCHVPFVGSNRKPIGGDVEISIRIRVPLRDKEYTTVVSEVLHVGDYPPVRRVVEPLSEVGLQGPRQQSQSDPPPRAVAPEPSALGRVQSQPRLSAPTKAATTQFAMSKAESIAIPTSREEDEEDPHDLELIISYDVINEEMEKIQTKLPMLSGAAARDLRDRFDSLGLKKQLLEIEIETGKLTQEMYTARLHQRVADDRALIARLLKAGRRPDAARVLHRVKIMEKELASGDSDV
ncbi:hypothetical protein PINS_up003224 [Pythium insidiosum]|nr:hypothetical protein PINS_up003224 [Pythium insidiosum]